MASKLEWSISEVFIKVLEVEAAAKLNDHENHMLFVMKCKICHRADNLAALPRGVHQQTLHKYL